MLSMKVHTFAAFLLLGAVAGGAFTLVFVNHMATQSVCEQMPGKGKALSHVDPVDTGSHKGY